MKKADKNRADGYNLGELRLVTFAEWENSALCTIDAVAHKMNACEAEAKKLMSELSGHKCQNLGEKLSKCQKEMEYLIGVFSMDVNTLRQGRSSVGKNLYFMGDNIFLRLEVGASQARGAYESIRAARLAYN